MPQPEDQTPESRELSVLYAQFEEMWKDGEVPDIRLYLPNGAAISHIQDLVRLDLEYRWKQFKEFGGLTDERPFDAHGFPLFPKLEDYASLDNIDRDAVLTPRMVVEEMYVRTKWGDKPEREDCLSRIPGHCAEVAAEFDRLYERLFSSLGRGTESELKYTKADEGDRDQVETAKVPQRLGRYELIGNKPLGRGGFGEVWKALDPNLGRYVAIKIPRPDKMFPPTVIEDFKAEGKKLAQLDKTDGIIRVYDADTNSGHTYIVSEFVEGESLAKRLARRKVDPLEHTEVALLVARIARALHKVHRSGLVHRDIKPGNILLDKKGKPYLGDFGLAATEEDKQKQGRGILGTYGYMPPEQASGNSHYAGPRSDVYSLGVVLFEMLAGERPFTANNRAAFTDMILYRTPPSLRSLNDSIPDTLQQIVEKCLAKSPTARFPSAMDLATTLERFVRQSKRRRFPWKTTLLAFAVCLVVAIPVVCVRYFGGDRAPNETLRATPKARENLLDGKVTKLIWEPGDPHNNYGFSSEGQRFFVDTNHDAVFLLGETTSKHFSYRVRFALEDDWQRFGLMWGYGKKQRALAPSSEKAHAVLIRKRTKGPEPQLSELTFSVFHRSHIPKIAKVAAIDYRPAPSKEFELEIEIENGAVTLLKIQGVEIPDLQTSKPVFQTGGIGIVFMGGDFVVTEAWYLDKEHHNDR